MVIKKIVINSAYARRWVEYTINAGEIASKEAAQRPVSELNIFFATRKAKMMANEEKSTNTKRVQKTDSVTEKIVLTKKLKPGGYGSTNERAESSIQINTSRSSVRLGTSVKKNNRSKIEKIIIANSHFFSFIFSH